MKTTIVTFALGYPLLYCYLIAMCTDILMGMLRACKERRLNSCFGSLGILRKTGVLVSIAATYGICRVMDLDLSGLNGVDKILRMFHLSKLTPADFVCLCYFTMEFQSIIKNMALCGILPESWGRKLTEMLKKYTGEMT